MTEFRWPDVPAQRLCEACLEGEATGPDQRCDDCAADHEADRAWEAAQDYAREQADLDAAETARENAWRDEKYDFPERGLV